jgi:hypothetical protein
LKQPEILTKAEIKYLLKLIQDRRRKIAVDYQMYKQGWCAPHYQHVAREYQMIGELEAKLAKDHA